MACRIADALGRVGVPDDIGGAVAALLWSGNGRVNARRIEASGRMFIEERALPSGCPSV